jgi:outer membrane biosynthesis protein TonB
VPMEAPSPPPPEAKPADAPEEATAGKRPVVAPQAKLETSHAKARPKSDRPAPLVPPPKAPPVEDLAARLESLSRQQQLQARLPANPRRQDGAGASNVTASNDSAVGREASYDVRDFIRVQVARHWRPDLASLGAGEFVVAIHLLINRDGSVGSAEIVDDPSHSNDAAYRSLALSARNAALLASPLTVPQGRYDAVRDITIRLGTRDALR